MRTRNKAAKEQNSNRARPKRGGTETPEPKTPIKQANMDKNTPTPNPATPAKKKGKSEKSDTPSKNRKRAQDKIDDAEVDEKELGLFKKKRERAESPSSVTTDSGSINDDVEANEPEAEAVESAPTTTAQTTTTTTTVSQEGAKPAKTESGEERGAVVAVPPTVPVIVSTKATPPSVEPLPLNVSIRLPDDINERKNLIKSTPEVKDLKFGSDVLKKETSKSEPIANKVEKEVKDEVKEIPEKFKTELIIPKVVTMDKVIIKEEVESSNEAINLNSKEDGVYKENLFVPQNMIKDQINFSLKEPILNHYPQENHPLNLKDTSQQHERGKEQIVNMNHSSFIKDVKQEPNYGYNQNKPTSLCHSMNNMIKLEPHDEPMELTSQTRSENFSSSNTQPQPLNIPTVIPSTQLPPTGGGNRSGDFDEEKQRVEKLERPERIDRPERTDLGPITSSSIGQPPIPSLMQSSNLVTIGGSQPPPMSHYGYMAYNHPQSPRAHDTKNHQNQNEPQNLKIKQEVPDNSTSQSSSMPPSHYSQSLPPSSTPTFISPSSSHMQSDPLQSLKDVKVPGYLPPPPEQTQSSTERPPSGPAVDNIKKEPEFTMAPPTSRASPAQIQSEKCTTPKTTTTPTPVAQTPPGTNSPHSAINLISPSAGPPPSASLPQPMHPSQGGGPSYPGSLHPSHALMHPSFLHAMHQFHTHPYSGYPFPYPYPYPVPQPHAIPPPSTRPELAKTIDTVSATVLSAQHTSSSTMTAKREIRENDGEGAERHQTHEMTLTHHQSTSHHSSVHASTEKQSYGGGASHSITISHSTSTSSSQSVQHKVNQKTVRTSSPHPPVSQQQSTTTSNMNHSSSSSNHQHTHHHTHHHDRLSPANPLLRMHKAPPPPQTNPHHLMIQPPSMGHHPQPLGPPAMTGNSSLDALRAHAAQAAANMQQNAMHPPSTSPMNAPPPPKAPPVEEVKVEPEPDPVPEEEGQTSPIGPPRGPSPEPRVEDTECHRSQSAIFLRHWNRGDYNSCTRTDLTFKPVPDSKLARKREERLRKQAEREREERERAQQAQARKNTTPEKPDIKPPSRGPLETVSSPYERFPRPGFNDTPALRQLSEYARPHAGFSPGHMQRSLLPPAHVMDPIMQYQLNSMYGPGARERLELEHLEREKREREMREIRERELNERLKEEIMKTGMRGPPNPMDPHWMEIQRRWGLSGYSSRDWLTRFYRYAAAGLAGPGGPAGLPLHHLAFYPGAGSSAQLSQLERERLERLGIPAPPGPPGPPGAPPGHPHHPHAAQLEAAERLALATDPMVQVACPVRCLK
jgi:arginine-glutamic acid dipeptide repeat-containing protein